MSTISVIIEEKFEGTNLKIKKIFKLYEERVTSELWNDSIFLSNDEAKNFPELKSELFCLKGFYKDLYYNDERIYPPILVNFKNKTKEATYEIFTEKYFKTIYKELSII